ncbi:PREDICTED: uncharacterized protein LOC107343670 [Acropora digitifera]|uniref:uncharacterized protein LOC107343670 n=1 Tax=Acropora digitifera TaxID=70779 RepID=UPI00077A7181|nr:PREDICTED: uncharacterized protein LOC107343670 [Acropora digitifera]
MTKSEVCDLLTTLEQDQSFQHTPPANKPFQSTVSLSITSFLGCFEFASVKSRSNDDEARADDRDGPSGVESGITVAVRRGLSSDMTLQLASFLFKMCLMGHCPAGKLAIPFDSSGINPQQLMVSLNMLISR